MKKVLLIALLCCAFLLGYSGAEGSAAYPGAGVHGRGEHRGYFTNTPDSNGSEVLRPIYNGEGMPSGIDTAQEFVDFIKWTKLDLDNNGSSNGSDKTGAAFIVHTMLGTAEAERGRPPSAAQLQDWEARVFRAANNGWITWRTNYSFVINSYYQGTSTGSNPNDDAFYDEADTKAAMLFRDSSGAVVYALKWSCGNPIGITSLGPLESQFAMNGQTDIIGSDTPRPGETVTFRHTLTNTSTGSTNPYNIWWVGLDTVNGIVSGGAAPSGVYAAGESKVVQTEAYTVPTGTPAGTQICRQVGWDPVNSAGARDGRGTPRCATVRYDYGLTPHIQVSVEGASTNEAEAGDQVTFRYIVDNAGSTESRPTACTTTGRTFNGYEGSPGGLTPVPAGTTCGVFPRDSSTQVGTETFTAAANTTVCRVLSVSPSTHVLPPVTASSPIACVYVVNKPYMKIFGGDVVAGGGLANATGTCTNNTNAAIIGWNKRNNPADPSNAWAGAGTQYAAFALDKIRDFATTQQGSGAPAPSGLGFANQTITAGDQNTGLFGKGVGSVPCIPDYYATRPDSGVTSLGNTVSMNPSTATGVYSAPPNTTINGVNIGNGRRVVLFVDGDVYIRGNITYNGNWGVDNAPLFELVARGNIFVDPGVEQLDGVFIAQQRPDGSKGHFHTCTNPSPSTQFTTLPLDGNLFSLCDDRRLTVNGSVVAVRILLLRTLGTVRQGTANEARTGSSAAEIFNYNPVTWIAQPTGLVKATPDDYDSITSLPPIL